MTRRLRFATARQVFDAFPAARDDIESAASFARKARLLALEVTERS